MEKRNIVEVVAALIWRDGKFLGCQRPADKKRALLWEFPGGKVEPGETGPEALRREIREELGTDIEVLDEVWQTEHVYPDIHVRLHLYNTRLNGGEPQQIEHAALRWLRPDQTQDLAFCPADTEILRELSAGRIQPPQEAEQTS